MPLFIVVLFTSAFLSYALYRRKKVMQNARSVLEHQLEENAGLIPSKLEKAGLKNLAGMPAIAAAITVGDVIYHCSKMDPDVLDALEMRAEGHPDSIWEVHEYVSQHIDNGATVAGMTNYWQGVTGELIVADKLQEAGHSVVFAESPTQAGYDLVVDGEIVQVKTSGIEAVSEHFHNYPDIPVVAAEQFGEASGNVAVMDGLDAADVHESAANTLDAADNLSTWTHYIPVITLSLSSYRNFKKVWNKDASAGDAALFVVQDTAAVGCWRISRCKGRHLVWLGSWSGRYGCWWCPWCNCWLCCRKDRNKVVPGSKAQEAGSEP